MVNYGSMISERLTVVDGLATTYYHLGNADLPVEYELDKLVAQYDGTRQAIRHEVGRLLVPSFEHARAAASLVDPFRKTYEEGRIERDDFFDLAERIIEESGATSTPEVFRKVSGMFDISTSEGARIHQTLLFFAYIGQLDIVEVNEGEEHFVSPLAGEVLSIITDHPSISALDLWDRLFRMSGDGSVRYEFTTSKEKDAFYKAWAELTRIEGVGNVPIVGRSDGKRIEKQYFVVEGNTVGFKEDIPWPFENGELLSAGGVPTP